MNWPEWEDQHIEEIFADRQLNYLPRFIDRMNPYNLAPWNIGYFPARIDRTFCYRDYHPSHYRGYWPISRRNYRKVFNRPTWLPLHMQANNYRRFLEFSHQLVQQYQEKTQYLMKLFNEAEEKRLSQPFVGDREAYVNMLIEDNKILWQKYREYHKVK